MMIEKRENGRSNRKKVITSFPIPIGSEEAEIVEFHTLIGG